MIVIDYNKEIENYLKLSKDSELSIIRLDRIVFEISNGLEDELVCIHEKEMGDLSEAQEKKLKGCGGVVIFSKNCTDRFAHTFLVFNESSDLKSTQVCLTNLDRLFKQNAVFKSQLISMDKELSHIAGIVDEELLKVKKEYQQKSPKQYKKIRNLKLSSKYAAGESIGGEFFDLFQKGDKLLIFMTETSSYLASGAILSLFTKFKHSEFLLEKSINEFLESVRDEVDSISASKEKKIRLSLCSLLIDLKTHECRGHLFGNFTLYTGNNLEQVRKGRNLNIFKDNWSDAQVDLYLNGKEKLLITSPGLSSCWNECKSEKLSVPDYLKSRKSNSLEILDDIFFRLKKDRYSSYLPHDASAILVEVQKHAIHKV